MANEIKENTDLTQEIKQNLLKTWKVFSSAPLTYFKSLWPALLVNCIGVVKRTDKSTNSRIDIYRITLPSRLHNLVFISDSPSGWSDNLSGNILTLFKNSNRRRKCSSSLFIQ